MHPNHLRRREFITLLGGGAAWPFPARAQLQAMPVVAFITNGSPDDSAPVTAAFRKGLNGTGYVEGQNVTVEYNWARGYLRAGFALMVRTGANDPSATLAVHCGNGFDAQFEPYQKASFEPIQCCP
jgi:hypothetical protein